MNWKERLNKIKMAVFFIPMKSKEFKEEESL
jgi:hypothetical protein